MYPGRILYVISRYTYQSTFIVREIEELAARGWCITVLSLRQPVFDPRAKIDSLPFSVRYDRHFSPAVVRATFLGLFSHARAVAEYTWVVASAYKRTPGVLLKHLSVIPKALYYGQLCRTDGFQHLHAHWATVSTSATMLMSRVSGLPFSFTGHAWDIFCETELLPAKIRAARFVVTCTDFNRQHLLRMAEGHSQKIHVVYHGVPLQDKALVSLTQRRKAGSILTVGRWSEKKGFAELIAALALVRDAGVEFELRIVAGTGSGPYERRVRQAIEYFDLQERVVILPWMAHGDVMALMRQSDLFVLPCVNPSNGAMDGIPNVLIEALSVGLPVIASRLSGIPELVRHQETGLLVNERDSEALAAAIVWCLTHPEEVRRLAEEGRRLVNSTFDVDRTITSLEHYLRLAIDTRQRPAS